MGIWVMTTHSTLLNAATELEQTMRSLPQRVEAWTVDVIVVFMLEELAVAEGEGVDPSGNDITSF